MGNVFTVGISIESCGRNKRELGRLKAFHGGYFNLVMRPE